MGNHSWQDFFIVHCCNGVALMYSVLLQKTLHIKKIIIITILALRITRLFLEIVMSKFYLSSTTFNFGFFLGNSDVKVLHCELFCFDYELSKINSDARLIFLLIDYFFKTDNSTLVKIINQ